MVVARVQRVERVSSVIAIASSAEAGDVSSTSVERDDGLRNARLDADARLARAVAGELLRAVADCSVAMARRYERLNRMVDGSPHK